MTKAVTLFVLAGALFVTHGSAQDKDRGTARTTAQSSTTAVQTAIRHGIEYLEKAQDQGRWMYDRTRFAAWPGRPRGGDDFHAGLTALALYALSSAGVDTGGESLSKGLAWCKAHPEPFATGKRSNYCASILILALARIDAKKHKKWIHALAKNIASSQLDNGMWSYELRAPTRGNESKGRSERRGPGFAWMHNGDGSNTQFAVMALWTAQTRAQFRVPRKVWQRVRDYHADAQHDDGGWSYKPRRKSAKKRRTERPGFPGARAPAWMYDTSPAMTASGLFAYTCASAGLQGGERGLARARKTKVAMRGLTAFRTDRQRWPSLLRSLSFAHSVERVGAIHALPDEEWFSTLAETLVDSQSRNGSWRSGFRTPETNYGDDDHVYETALALLCLTKATRRR